MAVNIKNPEVCKRIQELADLTGESLTQAIAVAVDERLERIRRTGNKEGLAELLMAIGHASAPLWREPFRSTPHGDLLYDERGLPK